eukprot:4150866-Prorocentrum_lima.AAC.1
MTTSLLPRWLSLRILRSASRARQMRWPTRSRGAFWRLSPSPDSSSPISPRSLGSPPKASLT